MQQPPKRPRSVSQYKTFKDCPKRYFLERKEKVWQRPAAWTPQGTAWHAAVEGFEKSGRTMTLEDMQEVFKDVYAREVNGLCEVTPNLEYWFASGPYHGEKDIERRWAIGLEQVARYHTWRQGEGATDVIWIAPDGSPAIELAFEIDLDDVTVRGYIDQVNQTEKGLSVDDGKTGNDPGDEFQLGTYAVAMREKYGVEVNHGSYIMAGKKGKKLRKVEFDLFDITKEMLTKEFHWLDENIEAGNFPANPSPDKCGRCAVATSCDEAIFF